MDKDLAVALSAGEPRRGDSDHARAVARELLGDRDDRTGARAAVAHDASLLDGLAPGLELWLHERDDRARVAEMSERRRQRDPQRNEREIGDDDVDGLRQLEALAGVDPLHHPHALVAAQLPVQLSFADVDGVDAQDAALQQAVGEPAGRRSDIERNEARHVEAEIVQRALELLASARDEAWTGFDGDDRVLRDWRCGPVGAVT